MLLGEGLAEHVAELRTGWDCRFQEGALRKDRVVCEPVAAAATRKGFRGLIEIALRDDAPSSLFASRSVQETAGVSSAKELRVAGMSRSEGRQAFAEGGLTGALAFDGRQGYAAPAG